MAEVREELAHDYGVCELRDQAAGATALGARRRRHRQEMLPHAQAGRRSPRHCLGQVALAPKGEGSMKIVMRDGRVFHGTALQIVRAMQDIAFGVEDFTVPKLIEWVVANARKFEEVEVTVKGGTDERRGEFLVAEMLGTEFTRRMELASPSAECGAVQGTCRARRGATN